MGRVGLGTLLCLGFGGILALKVGVLWSEWKVSGDGLGCLGLGPAKMGTAPCKTKTASGEQFRSSGVRLQLGKPTSSHGCLQRVLCDDHRLPRTF